MRLSRLVATRPDPGRTTTSESSGPIASPDNSAGADPLGLHKITDPDNPTADIIIVHGLSGSALRTWSWQRDRENFWPKWLSQDDHLGSSRIFTFGYNSDFKGDAPGLNIIDFARDLLMHMLNCRDGIGEDRPILFIAHSMGGLVVKQAYILGRQDKWFSKLISSVTAIVFLATPHHGSQYAKILNRILASVSAVVPPKAYVAALDRQSPVLQEVNEGFSRQCNNLSLVSLHETLPTKVGFTKVMIVEKDSAVLGYPNETSASMHADHNTICKYKNEFDPNFVKLRDTLKRLMEGPNTQDARKTSVANIQEIQRVLGVVDVSQNDLYENTLNISREAGTWLASESGFAAWLRATGSAADPRFYWLSGLPGSGNTVLSAIVANKLQGRKQAVQYHFFSEAHREKRTVAYALRSIATQLALSHQYFRHALLSMYQETGISFKDQDQDIDSIWENVFQGIIFRLRFQQPLIWILDGIDEADTPDELLGKLSRIQTLTPVKIFFSSRPLKAISRFNGAHIRMCFLREEDTAEDIRRYAADTVRQALPQDQYLEDRMVGQAIKYSSGSFLWVKLALDALQENWHTEDGIRAVFTSLPKGMVPMYRSMLSKIGRTPRNGTIARRILTWAACSCRPLRLDELQVALEPELGNFTNLEDTITQLCGNFVKITSADGQKHLSLIHKTARDFLMHGDPQSETAPFIDTQEGNGHLALVCLRYLSSRHWRRHFDSINIATSSLVKPGETESAPDRLLVAGDGHPLLSYATRHWADHISNAPLNNPELLETLQKFLSGFFLSWVEAVSLSGDLRYLTRSGQCLLSYVGRHSHPSRLGDGGQLQSSEAPPGRDVEWIRSWAVDILRVVSKFGLGLVLDPPSVYRQLPAFCPRNSMIRSTYGTGQELLTVRGLKAESWDDCLATVSVGKDEDASQVRATEKYFVTLVSSGGIIVVWNAATCDRLRTIRVGGYIPLIALNKEGSVVAAVGFDNYSVWELLTGKRIYIRARPDYPAVMDLHFGAADYELVVGLSSGMVTRVDLRPGSGPEQPFVSPTAPASDYQGCPWRMALNPDLTKVAAAWRGRPPLVWDLNGSATQMPRKCRVESLSDSICGPEILCWHPDAESLFVLCQNTSLVEWRIYEGVQKEWTHVNAREITLSADGTYLLSSDYTGTISVWRLSGMNLIYRLIGDSEPVTYLAFSPSCQRFYSVGGSACRVWEPDALVRAGGQGMEAGSGVIWSTIAAEPTISRFDTGGQLVTALALGGDNRYYCCGREGGRVAIHDAVSGKRLRKLYSHRDVCDVLNMCWSESGRYMVSSDDGGYVIVKRLQVKEEGKWGVFPVFNCRLDEPVHQFLFSADDKFLLISTPLVDYVWDLKGKKEVALHERTGCTNRRWTQHPVQRDVLVLISTTGVHCHRWPIIEAHETSAVRTLPPSPTATINNEDAWAQSGPHINHRGISWASATADKKHIIYATFPDAASSAVSSLSYSDLSIEILDAASVVYESNFKPVQSHCASKVTKWIKHILGIYKTSLVFLDYDCWVCTWPVEDEMGRITRHFFIPRDWLNTSMPPMASINSHGTFFCPRYGDVAIVRNGIKI